MKQRTKSIRMLLVLAFLLSTMNVFSQDPDFHIYLCFGQSNMEGQGTIEDQDLIVDPRFKVMSAVNCGTRVMGNWYTAVPPLTRCDKRLSPADNFGKTMVANLPSNIKVGVINVSVGGCKIELFNEDTYQTYLANLKPGQEYISTIVSKYDGNPYRRLVEVAKLAQKDGVIKGILLHQGEANNNDLEWPNKVKTIYNNLIADLDLDPTKVPLLAGEVVNADQGGVIANMNSIIGMLPKTLPNSYVISSSQCPDVADNVHFSSAGYRELGKRYALKMLTLLAGETDKIAPDATGMRSVTSAELSKEMGLGWNIGNSLDAIDGETALGNPLVTKQLIDSVKNAGFNVVRIPVAWSKFSNPSSYTIDVNFMNRVEEVVNYVLANDMYAVLNLHWDGGWMQPLPARQEYVNHRLATLWKQIALRFRDYDDRLIFAGSNEVMVEGDYSTPKPAYYNVQNSFNQTFVNTIRATGGRNYHRYLAVQGFNTNINHTFNYFVLPTDVVAKKLLVEVHYFEPDNFTRNESSAITQWGQYATQPEKTEPATHETYADAQFKKMQSKFVNLGHGVIVGEYGAMARLNLGSNALNATHAEFRRYYLQYIMQSIVRHGLVPVYWDNGNTGNAGLGLFNRSTGESSYPVMVKSIVNTQDEIQPVLISTAAGNLEGNSLFKIYPNPVREQFIVEIQDHSIKGIHLYNSFGQKVTTLAVARGINTFNLSQLTDGLYFIEIPTPQGVLTDKIVKTTY